MVIQVPGTTTTHTTDVTIRASKVSRVFHDAFEEPIQCLKKAIGRLAKISDSFAILFYGGSILSPGLRSRVEQEMESAISKNPEIHIRYNFLEAHDVH